MTAPSASLGRPTRVLVVDDEPLLRAAARRLLRSAGYEVLEADCVEQALAMLQDGSTVVDAVLSDVGLPDRLGSELVREIAGSMPTVATLLMSADTHEYLVRTGRVPANAEVLKKPFRGDELLRALRRALAERSPLLDAAGI